MNSDQLLGSGAEMYVKCLTALHQQNTLSNIPTEGVPSNTAHQSIQYQFDRMNSLQPQPSCPVARNSPLARNNPIYYPYSRYGDREHTSYEQYLNYAYYYPWMHQMYPNMPYYLPNQQFTSQYNPNYSNSPITRASQYQHHKQPYNIIQPGNQLPTMLNHPTAQNASVATIAQPIASTPLMLSSTEISPESYRQRKMKSKAATRPMNSFMLYSKVHRNKVHSLYPHLDNRTVSKLLGETWYRMESNPKCEYTALAADLKKDHTECGPINEAVETETSELPPDTNLSQKDVFKLDPTPMQVINANCDENTITKSTLIDSSNGCFSRRLLKKYEGRINQLPQFDFSNYELPAWAKKSTPRQSAPYARSDQKKKLTGDFFFGPDFDIASEIKELEQNVWNRKVRSAAKTIAPTFNECQIQPKNGRCNRLKELILDLFKTKGFFPPQNDIDEFLANNIEKFGTKQYLNLKIREYRQKYMQYEARS